ncbi:MAG: NADH-quinone oxidoreductase subunit L [Planctomycetota bacterium]
MHLEGLLPLLLAVAWLLPLASFALIVFFGPRMGRDGHCAAYLATLAIVVSLGLSLAGLGAWLFEHPITAAGHHAGGAEHPASAHQAAEKASGKAAIDNHSAPQHAPADRAHVAPALPKPISGEWYALGVFGETRIGVGYYIDGLTLAMFCMVTLIASCIHVYSIGYMHDELDEVTDPLVVLPDGRKLRRPGRYARFFQYLSLFCFSMLGLVIAGNVAMVFVFWELVGICSYFLIGFYIERRTASNAANKAFIVNRVGDFGMIVGLMAVWAGMGTFAFGDTIDAHGTVIERGIFSQVRPTADMPGPVTPDGMVRLSAREEIGEIYRNAPTAAEAERVIAGKLPQWRGLGYGYWLLIVAGLGIFCGCVGKSAQFPLHVWLPDAMEGPTPVSALIHAATMVAAGVYLVGRFYPVFTPEVLLVIAHIGAITLFIAATIAIVATDIKRVLAYSTVSQLGYMMFALGMGGWLAGIFHLFTHAFFKSLLFLCSGSVIHACHTNEMPEMGGLRKKMPWTAYTMLVGCLAIAGAGIPGLIGLSGYYSKDFIIAQAYVSKEANPLYGWMFYIAVAGAGITAFYMFRLWYLTFAGRPRNHHVYEHAHESPQTMVAPLVVLAIFAVAVGWQLPWSKLGLVSLLEQARPAGMEAGVSAGLWLPAITLPAEHLSHEERVHQLATWVAFSMAAMGFVLATMFYGVRKLDSGDARRQFAPLHRFLVHKWWFDELYQFLFVRPTLWLSQMVALADKLGIDRLIDGLARLAVQVSHIDDWFDRLFVDRFVNRLADWTYAIGLRLRAVQSGNLRQYVMFIAVGTITLFVLMSLYWNYVVAVAARSM